MSYTPGTLSANAVGIFYGHSFRQTPLLAKLETRGFTCKTVSRPDDLVQDDPAVVILDNYLLSSYDINAWRNGHTGILVAEESVSPHVDLIVSPGFPEKSTLKLLELACHQWALKKRCQAAEADLATKQKHVAHLADIGIALSATTNLDQLLSKILAEGQKLCCCDAASLFLVRSEEGKPAELVFKLTQNSSSDVPFNEMSLPITNESIAGHVVINNITINIADVYHIPKEVDLHFDPSFDKATGYRTKSLIAIPMRNHRKEVIGVLEFINKKTSMDINIVNSKNIDDDILAFGDNDLSILRALSSQASIAIENNVLVNRINQLFEGFVKASVTAIEQRDPTTSGHSFRVAEFSTHLAQALPQSNHPQLKKINFSQDEIRELRYAALLHDFGKVGVREHVLVKAKKLMPERLETLQYRIALVKERLKAQAYKNILELHEKSSNNIKELHEKTIAGLNIELAKLDGYLKTIIQANEPSVLAEDAPAHLRKIVQYPFASTTGQEEGLIDEYDFLALSVKKGSLTEHERKEIESHVIHTYRFLNLIPWTPELSRIPEIAGAHHEKLDGSGYPNHKKAHEIPLASKIMTIADIFDALTASDRPYKKAMPKERALDIISDEAQKNLLDERLVNIFIESRSYDIDVSNLNSMAYDVAKPGFAHHTCDYDLHHTSDPHRHHDTNNPPMQ